MHSLLLFLLPLSLCISGLHAFAGVPPTLSSPMTFYRTLPSPTSLYYRTPTDALWYERVETVDPFATFTFDDEQLDIFDLPLTNVFKPDTTEASVSSSSISSTSSTSYTPTSDASFWDLGYWIKPPSSPPRAARRLDPNCRHRRFVSLALLLVRSSRPSR